MTLICKICHRMISVAQDADSAECPRCGSIVLLPAGKWFAPSELQDDDVCDIRVRQRVEHATELLRACIAVHDLMCGGAVLTRELAVGETGRTREYLAGVQETLQVMRRSLAYKKLVAAVNRFQARPAPSWRLDIWVPTDFTDGLEEAMRLQGEIETQQKRPTAGYLEADTGRYGIRMLLLTRMDAEKRVREIWALLQRDRARLFRARSDIELANLVESGHWMFDPGTSTFCERKTS